MKRAVTDPRLSDSPLSSAVVANGLVFVSGVVGRDPENRGVPDGFDAQLGIAMANLEHALGLASCGLDAVVRTNVYLVDRDHFKRMNELYAGYFDDPKPARTTLVVAGLSHPALLFEIDAIAISSRSEEE